jgi:hypothetical protein
MMPSSIKHKDGPRASEGNWELQKLRTLCSGWGFFAREKMWKMDSVQLGVVFIFVTKI